MRCIHAVLIDFAYVYFLVTNWSGDLDGKTLPKSMND